MPERQSYVADEKCFAKSLQNQKAEKRRNCRMPKLSECSKEVQIAYEKYMRGEISGMEIQPSIFIKISQIIEEELEERMRDYRELEKLVIKHELGK